MINCNYSRSIFVENNERNAALLKAMNLNAFSYYCDCSSEEQVKTLAAQVEEEIGPVDVLVNNAGILNGNSITMLSQNQIRKTFDVNVLAQFWVRIKLIVSQVNYN